MAEPALLWPHILGVVDRLTMNCGPITVIPWKQSCQRALQAIRQPAIRASTTNSPLQLNFQQFTHRGPINAALSSPEPFAIEQDVQTNEIAFMETE